MWAIGEKITPSTPCSVKSGRKATPMITRGEGHRPADLAGGVQHSLAGRCLAPLAPRWWKQFSIMMTVESTMMPKSTAPSEIRFAGVPVSTMKSEGDQQRERDIAAP